MESNENRNENEMTFRFLITRGWLVHVVVSFLLFCLWLPHRRIIAPRSMLFNRIQSKGICVRAVHGNRDIARESPISLDIDRYNDRTCAMDSVCLYFCR